MGCCIFLYSIPLLYRSIVFTAKVKYITPLACYKGLYVVISFLLKAAGTKHNDEYAFDS